jgi:hypothetical protein
VAFARRVVDIFEDLKKGRKGQPKLPSNLPPATETFSGMTWASTCNYRFADLQAVYKYLRFGKNLSIPSEWQGMFPKRIP